jgi:thiamine monophosphate kinase
MIERGRAITIIGEVVSGRGVRVYKHGSEITAPPGGYDHFGGKV